MPNWVWGVAFLVAYLVLTNGYCQNWAFPLEGAKVAPSLGARLFQGPTLRRTMTTIVQVEFRESLLSIRDEILQSLGHPVVSVLGSSAARNLDPSHETVGIVLIGHGAPWEERCNLAAHFREILPGVPIVASLRRQDKDVTGADYNLPADNPPRWVRTVRQALTGVA